MTAIGRLLLRMLCDRFKPSQQLEAEILVLRRQLNVLQQRTPRRHLHFSWLDRALFIWLCRCCLPILDAITIVRPETVVRWHRKGVAAEASAAIRSAWTRCWARFAEAALISSALRALTTCVYRFVLIERGNCVTWRGD